MKKNGIRLLVLMMCVVMVLGVVPGEANAVELDGVYMPQMQTFTVYYITEFADLQQMVAMAENDSSEEFLCYFDTGDTFVISQNTTIPANLNFTCHSQLVIPTGVTVDVEGVLYADYINNIGKLNIHKTVAGIGAIQYDLHNDGIINVWSTLVFLSLDAEIVNNGQINCLEEGVVKINCPVEDGDQIQEVVDAANEQTQPWRYDILTNTTDIHLSAPVELPDNVCLQLAQPNFRISGAPITINGLCYIELTGNCVIENDLVLNGICEVGFWNRNETTLLDTVTFSGDVTVNNRMSVFVGNVIFENAVKNNGVIFAANLDGLKISFNNPDLYNDQTDSGGGMIAVLAEDGNYPAENIEGLEFEDFRITDLVTEGTDVPYWTLKNYKGEVPTEPSEPSDPSVHEHSVVTDPAVAPTCLTTGLTEGTHCATCGEVFVKQEVLAALGHDYGLTADGNPDFWDTTCDVCEAQRVVDPFRPTHSMYRMYNPNTGEHFYTGDKGERQVLEAAGWKYEGVGFTFPASTGKPVYRLFQPSTGEHLYTMDENEKAALLAAGWNYEGIAFNSGNESEVPQYRLYNPNVTVGAYHFTASMEERDVLLAAGWQDQGIGFYTCWQ